MEMQQQCLKCGIIKPISHFGYCRLTYGPNSICKSCVFFAIYAIVDPRDSRIFYVGCTSDPKVRLTTHVREARIMPRKNARKANRLNQICAQGLYPIMVFIEYANEWECEEREMFWILRMTELGAPITNAIQGNPVRYYTDAL